MKNPNILIALVIIFVLILGIKYSYYEEKEQEKHPAVNEIALRPDDMFRNATHYYRDYGQRLTSIKYINRAIEYMELVEKDMDSTSNNMIEVSIQDLKSLVLEFEQKEIDENHMQHAFANALNALAYAQLRVSETYIEKGLDEDAEAATKYALDHLDAAMYFSEAAEIQAERHVIELLDELKGEENFTDEQVRKRIHKAVLELNVMLANSDPKKAQEAAH